MNGVVGWDGVRPKTCDRGGKYVSVSVHVVPNKLGAFAFDPL